MRCFSIFIKRSNFLKITLCALCQQGALGSKIPAKDIKVLPELNGYRYVPVKAVLFPSHSMPAWYFAEIMGEQEQKAGDGGGESMWAQREIGHSSSTGL